MNKNCGGPADWKSAIRQVGNLRYLLAAVLALAAMPCFGAAFDVDWLTVESNGWVVDVHIPGGGTNGTYVYGLGASNSLTGLESLKINVTSPGYTDTGATNPFARTVVGTKRLRFAYTNQAFAYEYLDGTGVILRVALSDYIHIDDTIVSGSVAAGFYTQGSPNNAASFGSFTNLSTSVTPRVLAGWSQPGYFPMGSNYTLSLVAFHYSGQQRRPVRAVQFWAKDSAGNVSPTNTVLNPVIDWSQPDAVPVIEYIGKIDASGFAQGSTVSNYAVVFPWWGKKLDFSDGVNPLNSPDYAPLITYCDKSNVWNKVYAIVDPGQLTPSNGKAVTNQTQALNGTAIPFATLADAINAVGATNNAVYGSNTYENCFVWATNGNYNVWGGANITSRNGSNPWLNISARPDLADWHNVIITNVNNNLTMDKTVRVRIYQMVCAVTAFANTFGAGYGDILIDGCEVRTNTQGVALISSSTNAWFRQTLISGMRNFPNPSGNQANSWAKVRGCTFLSFDGVDGRSTTINPVLLIGNLFSPQLAQEQYSICNDNNVLEDPLIWAYNRFFRGDEGQYQVKIGIGTNLNIGAAFIQNVVESTKSGASIPVDVMFSARANEWCTNFLAWNNTVLGKYHMPFAQGGFTTISADHYMDANNVWASRETIMDVANSNVSATNRWALLFGVGCFNNASTEIGLTGGASVGANPAGNDKGFDGVSSYFNVTTNSIAFQFFQNGSWCGGNTNGLGDYRLQSQSPAVIPALRGRPLLPYDIEGNQRGDLDPPGAYASAIPPKSGAFFGQ